MKRGQGVVFQRPQHMSRIQRVTKFQRHAARPHHFLKDAGVNLRSQLGDVRQPGGAIGQVRSPQPRRHRTMLLYLNEGMLDQASEAHTFLQEAHPQGSLAEGYAKLADEVWQSYLAQPDIGRACQIAQAYANKHPETILDPLYYGYANKIYTAVDICPYTD